jgi:hypothetical protein
MPPAARGAAPGPPKGGEGVGSVWSGAASYRESTTTKMSSLPVALRRHSRAQPRDPALPGHDAQIRLPCQS